MFWSSNNSQWKELNIRISWHVVVAYGLKRLCVREKEPETDIILETIGVFLGGRQQIEDIRS